MGTDASAKARKNGMPHSGSDRIENLLFPLDFAYRQAGLHPPEIEAIPSAEIPQPYHDLLVHNRDMTGTLERRHNGAVIVRALSNFHEEGQFYRRVLLVEEASGRPVEMGAIRIKLECLPEKHRARILENHVPLGRVLLDAGIEGTTRPLAFLQVKPNPEMMGVFWMKDDGLLYGRRTVIEIGASDIADIVEILPPERS